MLKLKNKSITYQVYPDQGVVVAIVKSYVAFPTGLCHSEFITKGVAHCSPGDTFDQNIGKKLARARAEKEAFLKYRDTIWEKVNFHTAMTADLTKQLTKVNDWIDHQRNYIKSF